MSTLQRMRSLLSSLRSAVAYMTPPASTARRSRLAASTDDCHQDELDQTSKRTADFSSAQESPATGSGDQKDNNRSLSILYQDKDYVVVDKPWDIAINTMDPIAHPVTVANLLEAALPHQVDPTCFHSFRFVHRLDFSTSGVLCIALNKQSAAKLSRAFQDRRTEKEYLAVLKGRLLESKLIELPIGEDSRASHKMVPVHDVHCLADTVRDAKTEFIPIEHGTLYDIEVTKAKVKLFTGRRHQIRVHALAMGYPILGDFTYTGDKTTPRMFLHAKKICAEFSDNHRLFVESPLDFCLDNATLVLNHKT